jgi:hypothetical protein
MEENDDFIYDPLKSDAIYQGVDKFSPIALSVSSPKIEPIDKRLLKANAYETMQHQAHQQISMLKKQADLIIWLEKGQIKHIGQPNKILPLVIS